MTTTPNENGPAAAATANRAGIAASLKPTGSDNPNQQAQQSAFAQPDNTGGKQAAGPVLRLPLRAAVDAMCKGCIYDPDNGNGTWREQVQACSSSNCPLHPVRPMSVKAQKRAAKARDADLAALEPRNDIPPLTDSGLGLNDVISDHRRAA